MKAFFQGTNCVPNLGGSLTHLWVGSKEQTLAIRYERKKNGSIEIMDVVRYPAQMKPWEWLEESRWIEAGKTDVDEVMEAVIDMVKIGSVSR